MLELIDNFVPKNALQTLVLIALFAFLVCCLQYHWNRLRLYRLASRCDGPVCLPFVGNALYFAGSTNDILNKFMKLFQMFKSPVRVWMGQKLFYLIFDPEDLEVIMNSPHALERDELILFAEPIIGTGLLTAPVPKWKRHRKIIMPTFNQRILDEFVAVFATQSEILLEQLKKEIGKGSFDIFHYVSRCSLDIICETAMGAKVEAQTTDPDYLKWANKVMELASKRIFNIWYHVDFIFNLTQSARDLREISAKMKAFTRTIVKNKREAYQRKIREQRQLPEEYIDKEPPTRNTFLQHLIELSEGGANFTDDELKEEVDTFMMAGTETTASTEGFILLMIGMHPDVQEKVYKEVLEVLGPDRAIEADDLGRFKYMERVIKETMRIFPVVPLPARTITKDIQLGNCVIPAGSSVVTMILQTHRSEKIWPKPLAFEPDRFLPEEISKRHPYAWLPFSAGPRNCVGSKYAIMAMKVVIATVVRRYKFTTDYKSIEDIKLKFDFALNPVDGFKVSVELRK